MKIVILCINLVLIHLTLLEVSFIKLTHKWLEYNIILFLLGADSDEEDPLDAFMKDLTDKTKSEESKIKEKNVASGKTKAKGVRQDIEEEDDEESYYRYIKENPLAGLQADDSDSELMEYDEDGNPIKLGKKIIDPLPAIDHSTISYQPFEKNFYEEHEEIKNLSVTQVTELKETLGLKVTGISIPKPVCSFAHFQFDEKLMNTIRKSEFTNPTPIQVMLALVLSIWIQIQWSDCRPKLFLLLCQGVMSLVLHKQVVEKLLLFFGQWLFTLWTNQHLKKVLLTKPTILNVF